MQWTKRFAYLLLFKFLLFAFLFHLMLLHHFSEIANVFICL